MFDLNSFLEGIRQGKGKPTINLSGIKITVEQLEKIAATAYSSNSPNMYTDYVLSNCGLTPAHIDVLKDKGIATLIADNNPTLGAEGGRRIGTLNLSVCDLSYSYAGGQLSSFKNSQLRTFVMRGGTALGVTLTDIAALMSIPTLREINVSGNALNFGNDGCLIIARNKNLTRVNVRGCGLWDDAAALLAQNGNLRSLDVSNCRTMTPAGMKSLGEIGSLVHFSGVGLNISAAPIAKNINLSVLDLNFNYNLGDAGFAPFANCKKLTSISLFQCGLTDASVDLMMKMPNLTYAEIGENNISYAKKLALQQFIKSNIDRISQQSAAPGAAMAPVAKIVKTDVVIFNDPKIYNLTKHADPLAHVDTATAEQRSREVPEDVVHRLHKGKIGFWQEHNKNIVNGSKNLKPVVIEEKSASTSPQ